MVRGLVLAPPRVQLAKALLETSSLKLTVPLAGPTLFPYTTLFRSVQLLGLPTGTIAGMQLTSVLVSCLRAVTTKAPELPRWLASLPSLAGVISEPTIVVV